MKLKKNILNTTCKKENYIRDNLYFTKYFYDFQENKKYTLLINVKNKCSLYLNSVLYDLCLANTMYFIPFESKNKIIEIQNYENNIEPIIHIEIDDYPTSLFPINREFNICYCFDKEYFIAFFASIYSLLKNIDMTQIHKTHIHLCIPKIDLSLFSLNFLDFCKKINKEYNIFVNLVFSIYIIDNFLIDNVFLQTTCYKGGNHLLNIGNFSRLITCNLIATNKLLYLDSDTIINKDITKIIKKINMKGYLVLGKKSHLTFKNILNSQYHNNINIILNSNIDVNKNIIYTGTLFLNPIKIKENFNKILNLVKIHNDTKNGLYKLFTMSIINISFYDKINYFDYSLNNVVDLGCDKNINTILIKNADVLDWSGMYKPWFSNGYYSEFWNEYNIMYDDTEKKTITISKNTVEKFNN